MNEYFSIPEKELEAMLDVIGAKSIDELFDNISEEIKVQEPLGLPEGMDDIALTKHIDTLAAENVAGMTIFAGGGIYDHYVPPVIDYLVSRGEFLTAYTPYQPEASQGTLQATFEYQSMICRITGMDVANASIYDGATALAEAVFMTLSTKSKRSEIVVAGTLNPQYYDVVATYIKNSTATIEKIEFDKDTGTLDPERLKDTIGDDTACCIIQHPNFFGCLEQVETLTRIAHDAGAKVIIVADPISLGILKRPGDYGADIVVAEGQPLGMYMYAGGETLGIFACCEDFMRRLPGRLVGKTEDARGKRAYTLTLQSREQHIRRERATSNICTNQALNAIRAAIYLALLGKRGFAHLATLCAKRTHYMKNKLEEIPQVSPLFTAPVFREIAVSYKGDTAKLKQLLAQHKIVVGPWGSEFFPGYERAFILAVTEKRSISDIDTFINVLKEVEC